MRLLWSSRSPYVRKAMVAAHELGLADRIETVPTLASMNGVNAALIAANPLGKIPLLLLPDGEAVVDSLAICECLDAMAGGGRLFPPPGGGRARRDALRWHALADGLLDILLVWRNLREKPAERQPTEWIEGFQAKIPAVLDAFARDVPALQAAPFGVGHVTLGCALAYLDFRFPDIAWREGRPGLAAWHEAFSRRPSAVATAFRDSR